MLAAYVLSPDGPMQPMDTWDAIRPYLSRGDAWLWIDIEGAETEAVERIGELLKLDASAVHDALHGEPRARIEEFEGHLFLLLYGAVGVEDSAILAPRKLAVFCSETFLVTIHPEPHRSIRNIRERAERNAAQLLSRGAGHVLYVILDAMVHHYVGLTDVYDEKISDLEERSLDATLDGEILAAIIPLRRELTELRRRAASVREVIAPIAHDEFDILAESTEHRFAHLRDHLTDVVETIDGLRDILHAILENYHASLAHKTNQTIRVLTVFATSLLPVSVMAGIYGMNLPIWPSAERPWSFWAVLGAMAAVSTTALVLFKRWGLW